MKKIKIRLAAEADYKKISDIWTQPHVLPWMSFSEMTPEIYAKLREKSDIYVLIECDEKGKELEILAVRRLVYGTGNRAHIASYCSMGVDQKHLGHKLGEKFYDFFLDIVRDKGIERIELTQSGGNEAAYHIANKKGFEMEFHLNGWLVRQGKEKGSIYHLEERGVCYFLNAEISKKSVNDKLVFDPSFPAVASETLGQVAQHGYNYICYDKQGHKIGICTLTPSPNVVGHIAFLDVHLIESHTTGAMADCLRQISVMLKQAQFKKIEIYTHEKPVTDMLQTLGFQYRGEKVAALKIEGRYYNEAAVDLGFFNIEDAKSLLKTLEFDLSIRNDIFSTLDACKKSIEACQENKTLDDYTAIYAENLAYQMIENTFGKYPHYRSTDWESLISGLPEPAQTNFMEFSKRISDIKLAMSAEPEPRMSHVRPGFF